MMIRVTVRYIGPVRIMLQKRAEVITVTSNSSVLDLLKTLAERYGSAFRLEVLDDQDALQESLLVTVNNVAIGQLKGVDTRLHDDDTVTLLPFFAGGG